MLLSPVPLAAARLAGAAGRGDRAALDALARCFQPVLEAQARRALSRARALPDRREELVEEVVAEVQAFLVVGAGGVPGWGRFEAARAAGEVEGWLYGIVRNKVRRSLRDARRRAELPCPPAGEEGERASPERALDAARALRLAQALPPRERAVLALWLEDEPSREIAARLRFASAHAVDCCLSRGKQRLRRMMLEGEGQRAA